ncbi:DUF1707 domain-containing protein [Rhodococcus sp. NPDC058505]|uniref:DUF1707 SHOCT-like domain-containing protein n=1 Tax=Rhodococcus sp. NPDC058505 TaxID=3346531 RepID=UPI00366087E4
MARPYPPSTRATDADRAAVLALLDAGYADGQLDAAEHRMRAELLTDGRTLGDLDSLVEDLQDAAPPRPTTSLPPAGATPDPAARPRRFRTAAAAAAAAAVVAGIAAFWFASRGDAPALPAAPGATAVDLAALPPRVIATPDLRTAAGFAQFVDDYRAAFGDTVVDELTLFEQHGSVTLALPREPNRVLSYSYRYGFEPDRDPSTRGVDTPTVDLADVDRAGLDRILAEAPTLLNVPGGTISHLSVEPDADAGPLISVYVGNEFDESGHLTATLAGEVHRAYPFGQ